MAEDLQRYAKDEPIEARPPSTTYRLAKLASRHRVALATTTLVLLSLAGGLIASLWQMSRVAEERDQKDAALQELELFSTRVTKANVLIASGESLAQANRWADAEQALDEAVLQQPSYYLPWVQRGQFFTRRNQFADAADDFAEALAQDAPIGTPQWWGVPALFQLHHESGGLQRYFDRYRKQLTAVDEETPLSSIHWEWIRNGVQVNGMLSDTEYSKLADLCAS